MREIYISEQNGTEMSMTVKIPEDKTFDFFRDVAKIAERINRDQIEEAPRQQDAEPEKNIEVPEPASEETDPYTIQLPSEEYTGFLHIQCEKCKEEHSFCAKKPTSWHTCRTCGHKTLLRNLKPLYMDCEQCGSHYKYMTNMNTAEFTKTCLQCGASVELETNSRRTAYVTKKMRGGV